MAHPKTAGKAIAPSRPRDSVSQARQEKKCTVAGLAAGLAAGLVAGLADLLDIMSLLALLGLR